MHPTEALRWTRPHRSVVAATLCIRGDAVLRTSWLLCVFFCRISFRLGVGVTSRDLPLLVVPLYTSPLGNICRLRPPNCVRDPCHIQRQDPSHVEGRCCRAHPRNCTRPHSRIEFSVAGVVCAKADGLSKRTIGCAGRTLSRKNRARRESTSLRVFFESAAKDEKRPKAAAAVHLQLARASAAKRKPVLASARAALIDMALKPPAF